jgi:glycosyltransferase involved in cell wall biosynthesis
LGAVSGIFHANQASLRLAEKWPALADKRWIRLFTGFQPDDLLKRDPKPIAKREGDFVVCLLEDENGSNGPWKEAMDAVQIVNRMPSSERADRLVRLVLPDSGLAALKLTIPASGATDPLGLLSHCDAVLQPRVDASDQTVALVAAALASNVPVIAPDRGVVHEMLTHRRLRAGIALRTDGRSLLDVEGMVSALLRYLNRPELHAAHSDDARRLFDERLHINAISALCAEAYAHARDCLVFPRETPQNPARPQGPPARESA